MEFSPWTIFTDLGLISLLLIVGTLLRAKVKLIQSLFLPAGIIAGMLGLLLGPNGTGLLPFSSLIGTYPGILIAIIFGALPLGAKKVPWKVISKRVGSMWSYAQFTTIVMWGGGALFGLLIISNVWGDIPKGFGLLLAAGFVGGHGTASAIGEGFANQGWEDATSLAMTSATIGVICSILIGLLLIKLGSRNGETNFITSFKDLPQELRTGLIPEQKREQVKGDSVSSISIDPLIFHLALLAIVGMGGYYAANYISSINPNVYIPVFSLAFIIGLMLQKVLTATKADSYVDKRVVDRISGGSTDLLVAFGIASINLTVVVNYALPLTLLMLFGLVYVWVCYKFLSKKLFETYRFEKAIYCWGWTTGTVAMGIALLRIVDPELKSNALDDYGLAYVPIAPVDILVVSMGPLLLMTGGHWLFTSATFGFGLAIIIFSMLKGWWISKPKINQKQDVAS